ncbi:MAG TPA: protein kinase [Pseudomonadota bacterium]|nr:protein kinase [Pseudomonadota bacterium]HNO67486.1 protein kinase [Pseudomonadota bacterium]
MKKPTPFGKYFLFDRVSTGGMAEIFRAKTVSLEGTERIVAVKKMIDLLTADKELTSMFIDEAKLAVQLNHPGICQVVDWGKVGDSYFIAMEYVLGQDLRHLFQRCKTQLPDGTPTMPLAQSCFVVMKLCEALDYAHNKQDSLGNPLSVVHRDVSPQNVLVSYEGEVKLIDFGIAKASVTRETQTEAGVLKGKFAYMSPEQVRGDAVDRRSDVFSTGIVLYELLTGERLFPPDQELHVLEKIKNVEVLPPTAYNRKIPEELDRIVMKALAGQPADRYQTAMDLHADLQSFLYTSGEFFSRKDLAAWMKRVFRTEMDAEQNEIDAIRDTKVALPTTGADSLQRARATLSMAALKADPAGGLRTSKETGSIAAVKATGAMKAFQPEPGAPNEWMSTNAKTVKNASSPPRGPVPTTRPSKTAASATKLKPVTDKPSQPRVHEVPVEEDTAVDGPMGAGKIAEPNFADDNLATKAFPQQDQAALKAQVQAAKRNEKAGKDGVVQSTQDAGDIETQQYKTVDDGKNERDPLEGGPTVAVPPGQRIPGNIEEIMEVSSPVMLDPSQPVPVPQPEPTRSRAIPAVAPPPPLQMPDSLDVGPRDATQNKPQGSNTSALLLLLLLLALGGGAAAYWFLLRPGTVVVTVSPDREFAVLVDGKPMPGMDSSPVILTLPPGTHAVSVQRSGYKSWADAVTVQPGETLRVSAGLAAQVQQTGGFTLVTDPPGAMVFLDGASLGQVTPMRVGSVPVGTHSLELRLGARVLVQTITVEAGKSLDLKFPLPPEPTSKPAEPVVQKEPEKQPATQKEPEKQPEKQPVAQKEPEKQPVAQKEPEKQPVAQKDPERHIAPRPQPRPTPQPTVQRPVAPRPAGNFGFLRLNSKPWTKIFVDGQDTNLNTPQTAIQMTPGMHQIMLYNPEFAIRETFSVHIIAGETQTIIKDFRK